jgi:hypothetical protein
MSTYKVRKAQEAYERIIAKPTGYFDKGYNYFGKKIL